MVLGVASDLYDGMNVFSSQTDFPSKRHMVYDFIDFRQFLHDMRERIKNETG
jgi:hypothetical protein